MSARRARLDIAKYIPEISRIKDKDIREKTAKVWSALWSESKFARLEDLPVNTSTKYPHIVHNRSVVVMAIEVAETVAKFHKAKVDMDVLISSAILQDASKLVETEPDGKGGTRKSDLGGRFQHAFYAAHMALEEGLPIPIAENIMEHTFDNSSYPKSLEAKILFYVDQVDMAALGLDRWKKTGAVYR